MEVAAPVKAGPGHNSKAFGEDDGAQAGILKPFRAAFTNAKGGRHEIDIVAVDERDARRRLRVTLATPTLPADLILTDLAEIQADVARRKAKRMRHLLRVLADHYMWLSGIGGKRANLANMDLSDVVLEGRDLSQANLSGCDLSRAALTRSNLNGADLSGARLTGTDLRGADLRGADLSNADLRGAILIGARLEGADVWRANFAGATIAPETLHQTLNCRRTIDRIGATA